MTFLRRSIGSKMKSLALIFAIICIGYGGKIALIIAIKIGLIICFIKSLSVATPTPGFKYNVTFVLAHADFTSVNVRFMVEYKDKTTSQFEFPAEFKPKENPDDQFFKEHGYEYDAKKHSQFISLPFKTYELNDNIHSVQLYIKTSSISASTFNIKAVHFTPAYITDKFDRAYYTFTYCPYFSNHLFQTDVWNTILFECASSYSGHFPF